jgi:hypothetical protein
MLRRSNQSSDTTAISSNRLRPGQHNQKRLSRRETPAPGAIKDQNFKSYAEMAGKQPDLTRNYRRIGI